MFFGGIAYLEWYKAKVLDKVLDFWLNLKRAAIYLLFQIEEAFSAGYDPALELARRAKQHEVAQDEQNRPPWDTDASWNETLRRNDQDQIDRILHGEDVGHYFLLLGPKVRIRIM